MIIFSFSILALRTIIWTNRNDESILFNIIINQSYLYRSTLQRWKQSLHVPLRLDVYYQYVEPSNNKNGEAESAPQNVRRELLERWCIDYIASKPNQNATSRRNHASNTNTKNTTSMDIHEGSPISFVLWKFGINLKHA